MLLMKKDMGGAACVLALARMVMESALPVRLRVLIPAVENADRRQRLSPGRRAAHAQGPHASRSATPTPKAGWCWPMRWRSRTRSSPTCWSTSRRSPARRASRSGPELPAVFGTRDATVDALVRHGRRLADPLWPMPLWAGYDDEIVEQDRRPQQRLELDLRRRDHRRAVPAALRHRGARLAARRPVRLEPEGPARAARSAPSRRPCARCTRCWSNATAEPGAGPWTRSSSVASGRWSTSASGSSRAAPPR